MPSFTLESQRLLLRPPGANDLGSIVALMGDWEVVKNLSRPPHPYLESHAREFLARQEEGRAKGADFVFAIVRKADGALAGCAGLHLRETGFELGYWLGKPFWGFGFATEAAREVLAFGFRNLRAEIIEAGWFHDNPASGRVLEKLGFRRTGTDSRDCAARGHAVLCHTVAISRAEHGQRDAA
jgi:RimJ/RimL family protein N-acetyltransferase